MSRGNANVASRSRDPGFAKCRQCGQLVDLKELLRDPNTTIRCACGCEVKPAKPDRASLGDYIWAAIPGFGLTLVIVATLSGQPRRARAVLLVAVPATFIVLLAFSGEHPGDVSRAFNLLVGGLVWFGFLTWCRWRKHGY